MKDWYIIFKDEMVRAILDGRKTCTRRLSPRWAKLKKGDRLLVKEAAYIAPPNFADPIDATHTDNEGRPRVVGYAATMDPESVRCAEEFGVKKRPSIFMPRWAVRIELEATVDAYQEPLQDISEEDAKAEGVFQAVGKDPAGPFYLAGFRGSFAKLWNSINTRPGTRWEDNPSPFVIHFRRTKP